MNETNLLLRPINDASILEIDTLDVIAGENLEFEQAFKLACPIIASIPGLFGMSYSNVWKMQINMCYLFGGKSLKIIRLDLDNL